MLLPQLDMEIDGDLGEWVSGGVSGISFATPTGAGLRQQAHVARWSIGRGKYRSQKEESLVFSKKDYTHTSKEMGGGEQNTVSLWRDTLWGKNISTSGTKRDSSPPLYHHHLAGVSVCVCISPDFRFSASSAVKRVLENSSKPDES